MLTETFVGPDRDGCTDLPEIDLAKWFSLGGEDIAVDCGRWIVKGTREAIDYIISLYNLSAN